MASVRKRGGLALVLGFVVSVAAVVLAVPADAHVIFPASAGFGFAPNTSGGLGTDGGAPPYVPGSTQTLWLRAPNEQTTPFNGTDDTTVDVKITVPAGFTSPACGQARMNLKDATTNGTNQPGAAVAGWSCAIQTVSAHSVVHFSGPQLAKADAPEWYPVTVKVPVPATQTTYGRDPGTEGFTADQQYASGLLDHWIPAGVDDPGTNTFVAPGLFRTVGGPGTAFHPVSPTRILDSRTGTGWSGRLSAGSARELSVVAGAAAVPATVDAVVLNVTATESDANSFLTVYPAGTTPPTASNLNFAAYETIPNLVTVKVSPDGKIAFDTNTGSTDVTADIVGYYDAAASDRFNPLTPARILDSRTAVGGFVGPVTAGTPQSLQVQAGGVAATATAVVMNVTVTNSNSNSFLTVYPGSSPPNASNLNFAAGQTIANLVTVPVGTNGQVNLATAVGHVDVIADVVGYYSSGTGDLFHSLPPWRVLDSRTTIGGWAGPLAAGIDQDLQVTGYGGVRFDATSVVANTTVTGGTQNSYLTAYPAGQPLPGVSNVNFAVGQTIPNLTTVKLGTNGQVRFDNRVGSTDVIYDVVGYFAPLPVA